MSYNISMISSFRIFYSMGGIYFSGEGWTPGDTMVRMQVICNSKLFYKILSSKFEGNIFFQNSTQRSKQVNCLSLYVYEWVCTSGCRSVKKYYNFKITIRGQWSFFQFDKLATWIFGVCRIYSLDLSEISISKFICPCAACGQAKKGGCRIRPVQL